MTEDKKLKLVLVGIGSAGRSRLKAVSEVEGVELGGLVSRRPGVGDRSFEEVLADSSVDAVAVSMENAEHASVVRRVLQSGKHVLCDYPLAFSEKEAASLFSLAADQNKILHVEHLGVLMLSHQIFKRQMIALGGLREGEFIFTANWNEKLRDEKRQGPFSFLAESRLVQLADLFGDFEAEETVAHVSPAEARLSIVLRFKRGGTIRFLEHRFPDAPRKRHFSARFEGGELNWPEVKEPLGLFAQDLAHFRDRVQDGIPNYYDEGLMLKALKVLEGI